MKNIFPCLWFDHQAEEAAQFYTSIFPNATIGEIVRYGEEGPGEPGSVLTIMFNINGQDIMALNGGPVFQFSPAISFFVNCETQEEVDYLWEKLSEGGEIEMCGWLKDKYGVSWQIVPTILGKLISDPDPIKARRVTQAMLQMRKLEIDGLLRAYEQG